MIDSSIYSKSQILENNLEEFNSAALDTDIQINRSTLYHLLLSFTKSIHS